MDSNWKNRTQKDCSLSLKLLIVQETEQGLLTPQQVTNKCGIQAKSTIWTWLKNMVNFIYNSKIDFRKLYCLLENELKLLKVGRDMLFKILKVDHFLFKSKRKYHITINCHHRFRKHKNKIKD